MCKLKQGKGLRMGRAEITKSGEGVWGLFINLTSLNARNFLENF